MLTRTGSQPSAVATSVIVPARGGADDRERATVERRARDVGEAFLGGRVRAAETLEHGGTVELDGDAVGRRRCAPHPPRRPASARRTPDRWRRRGSPPGRRGRRAAPDRSPSAARRGRSRGRLARPPLRARRARRPSRTRRGTGALRRRAAGRASGRSPTAPPRRRRRRPRPRPVRPRGRPSSSSTRRRSTTTGSNARPSCRGARAVAPRGTDRCGDRRRSRGSTTAEGGDR